MSKSQPTGVVLYKKEFSFDLKSSQKSGDNSSLSSSFSPNSLVDPKDFSSGVAVVTDSEEEYDDPMIKEKASANGLQKDSFKVPPVSKTKKAVVTSARKNRSPVTTPRQLTPPQVRIPTSQSFRRMSSEEIINEMEKEQDAIVMRLLREIHQLKDENAKLRKNLNVALSGGSSDSFSPSSPSSRRPSSARSSLSYSPASSSPMCSRRPSSAASNSCSKAVPIDTITPTLSLQRKRNSTSNVVLSANSKNDEFFENYPLATIWPQQTSVETHDSLPRKVPLEITNAACGSRRRRSSGRLPDDSKKLQRLQIPRWVSVGFIDL